MFPYLLQIGLEVVDKGSNIINQSVSRFIEIFFTGCLLGLKCWKNNASLVQICCYKSKFLILLGVWVVLSFHQTWIQCQIFVCFDFLMQKMPQTSTHVFGCSIYYLKLYCIALINSLQFKYSPTWYFALPFTWWSITA